MKTTLFTLGVAVLLLQSPFFYQEPNLRGNSDHRRMQAIQPVVLPADDFLRLEPITWEREGMSTREVGLRGDLAYFIAGPYIVHAGGPNPDTDPYTIDYGRLGVLTLKQTQDLIRLTREQQHQIDYLRQEVDALRFSRRPVRSVQP